MARHTFTRAVAVRYGLRGLLASLLAVLLAAPVAAGTVTWVDGNGDWSGPTNWSSNPSLPGPTDNVIISQSGSTTVTHTTGNDLIGSFSCDETLLMTGGTLSIGSSAGTGAVRIAGNFTVNGSAALAGITALNSAGTLGGSGSVTIDGLNWTGGTMSGNGTTTATGASTLSGNGDLYLDGRTFNNSGTATLSGSFWLHGKNGAVVNNLAGGLIDLQQTSPFKIDAGGAAPTLINSGTFQKSGAGSSADVAWGFSNSGTVLVQAGTLSLSGSFGNAGTAQVQSGALKLAGGGNGAGLFSVTGGTLGFAAGTYDLSGATFGNSGTVSFSGATVSFGTPVSLPGAVSLGGGVVNFNGNSPSTLAGAVMFTGNATLGGSGNVTISSLTWVTGTMNGSGTTTVTGVSTLNANTDVYLDGRTFNNSGTMTLSGGIWLHGKNGAVFNNLATGLIDVQNNDPFKVEVGGAMPTLNNAGVFQFSAPSSPSDVAWAFVNTGTALLVGGTGSTPSISGSFNNTGLAYVQTGTLSLAGTDSSSGLFRIAPQAVLTFSAGSHTLGGATITNSGTVNFNNSTTDLNGASVANFGAVNFNNGTHNLGGGTFTNSGTFNFSGGTENFGSPATLPGLANFNGGTVNFNNATSGASCQLTGTATLSAGILGGSGQVSLANSAAWTGGIISNSGGVLVPITGTLGITANGQAFSLSGGSPLLVNSGNVTLGGAGTIYNGLATTATINNQTGGVFDVQGNANIANNGASVGTFNNAGLLKKSAGSGTSSVAWTLNNSGIVQTQSGTLAFNGAFNNTGTASALGGTLSLAGGGSSGGTFNVASGAALAFAGGTHTLGGATFNNSGSMNFSGGIENFTTQITLSGAVNFNGGAVNFNDNNPPPAGTYQVTGAAALSSGSLGGSSAVTFNNLAWTGGNIGNSGGVYIPTTGTLAINAANQGFSLSGGTVAVNNGGNVTLGGSLSLYSFNGTTSTINNQSGAVFDVQGNASIANNGTGSGIFNNAGLLKKSGGTGTSNVGWTVSNSAMVQTQTGTLSLNGGFSNTGTAQVLGGALSVAGPLTQLSGSTLTGGTWIVQGNGSLNLATNIATNQATVVLDGAGSTFAKINTLADNQGSFSVLEGRTFTTLGALNNSGTLTAGGSTGLTVASSLAVAGSLNWTGGNIGGDGFVDAQQGASLSGTLTKFGAGAMNLGETGSLSVSPSTQLTVSGGTLNLAPGGGIGSLTSLVLTSSGAVNAGGADQYFSAGTSIANDGLLTIITGTKGVASISGVGSTTVQAGVLRANSIMQHQLTVSAGAKVKLGGVVAPGAVEAVASVTDNFGGGASAVPEPSALVLLGVGLACVICSACRRRNL